MSETPLPSSAPLPAPRRSWIKTLVLGTVLLVSGMVIGSGLTVIGIRRWAEEMRQRPDLFSNRVLARMESDLNLTKGQKAELSKIFKASREELDEVRSQHRVQAQAFFKDFHDQVAQVLTPSQQKEWEEWWKRARERAFKERNGGPPRAQGGGDKDKAKEMKSPDELKQRDGAAAPEPRPEPPQGIPERHFGNDPAAPTP